MTSYFLKWVLITSLIKTINTDSSCRKYNKTGACAGEGCRVHLRRIRAEHAHAHTPRECVRERVCVRVWLLVIDMIKVVVPSQGAVLRFKSRLNLENMLLVTFI